MYCMVYAFLPVSMYVRTMYIMYTISYCRIIIAHLNQGYYYSWRPITVTQMNYISLSIDREFFFYDARTWNRRIFHHWKRFVLQFRSNIIWLNKIVQFYNIVWVKMKCWFWFDSSKSFWLNSFIFNIVVSCSLVYRINVSVHSITCLGCQSKQFYYHVHIIKRNHKPVIDVVH